VAQLDLVDQTWIRATPAQVAAAVAEPANWARWWPGFTLRTDELRGPQGARWSVLSIAGWEVRGRIEVWLRPDLDGVLLNFLAQLDRDDGADMTPPQRDRLRMHLIRQAKHNFWQLKDELEVRRR
jgi:hypothetical protein